MQWNIQINQLAIDKYRKENKYKIDGSDAMIIDCIHQFCSTKIAQKNAIKIDDDIYFYLSYQLIIDQLPLLDIENKQVVSRRIQKLQEYGIIKTKILKELGNKLYITTTDILNSFYTKTPIDLKVDTLLTQKLTPSQPHSQNPIDSKVDTLLTQKLNNNIDKNNKDYYNDNNIKKENVFVEPATKDYLATDFTENQKSTDIILDEPNEVVVERNKQYSENNLITDDMMVLDCFVSAGISVFNDGQFGFGSKLVKDVSLQELYDKTAIMQWGKFKIFNQSDTLTICQVNNATYKQLYNVIYQTFQKGYKNLNYINSYLDKELKKINQLTYSKNDSTNISGSNQQEQSGSTERYITSGTTKTYGTGAEALQRYLADNVEGYKR